jgi:hypothetical protein
VNVLPFVFDNVLKPFNGDRKDYESLPTVVGVTITSSCDCKFGQIVPNIWDWRVGDVVLVRGAVKASSLSEKAVDSAIVRYQRAIIFNERKVRSPSPDEEAAVLWTHVAVFDGQHLWEAMPGRDVNCKTLRDYFKDPIEIAIRRFKNCAITKQELNDAIRELLGSQYPSSIRGVTAETLAARYRRAISDQHDRSQSPRTNENDVSTDEVICSRFVQRVLNLATARLPLNNVLVALPADFALSDEFTSVPIGWFRAGGSTAVAGTL